jgi:phosphate transport system substrate-binding protein
MIAVIALMLLGGWWYLKHRPPRVPPVQITNPRAALRIHGSNTIGAELGPALVEAYLKSLGGTQIQSQPLAKKNESQIAATLPGESKPIVIEIFAHGSATAFEDLAGNNCDIGMASRKIAAKEITATAALGDLTSDEAEHVLGLDGVAVIVNKANPVESLGKDQLAKIFSGEIADWSGVSPASSGPVNVYSRDDKSGTFETFKTLVMKNKALAGSAVLIEDSKELSAKVSEDPHGIGFIGLPYILEAKAVSVFETEDLKGRQSRTRPMYPNRLTVATEDYPLSRRLYLYTPANPANPWTRKFVQFAISKAGQEIVGQKGFVSQNPTQGPPVRCKECPAQYRQLTENKNRLSLNFFFRSGKTALDTKAVVDINRVVDLLVDLKYNGKGIVLLGFADNRGSNDVNLAISKERADAVGEQFRRRGVNPEMIAGLGSDMAVASNDDPAGREKNRRVEIWVNR